MGLGLRTRTYVPALSCLTPLLCLALACCGSDDAEGAGDGGKDGSSSDGATLVDGRVVDGNVPDASSSGGLCSSHHECPQKEFCHRGACRLDAQPVYHCGKTGCPPGHWCVEDDGRRDTCPPDPTYTCQSACDCGPGHCCIDDGAGDSTEKRCVRDEDDPWLATPDPSTPSACEGKPTYCADAPECQVAFNIWERERPGQFLARQPGEGGADVRSCGGESCFGTACNCPQAGQVCADTVSTAGLDEGQTCGVLSGGTCVSTALAESVYRWQPGELLACCDESTAPGERCDAGWFHHGNRVAYQRIVAVASDDCVCGDGVCCPSELADCLGDCVADELCGGVTPCVINAKCGNGTCDPGEYRSVCPDDCITNDTCGDGLCASWETAEGCPADCAIRCGDGYCNSAEAQNPGACPAPGDCSSAGRCPDYREYIQRQSVCGDGVCAQERGCQLEEMESCRTCPMDCGTCAWELAPDVPPPAFAEAILDVHALAPDRVLAAGSRGLLASFDGFSWRAQSLGLNSAQTMEAVWFVDRQTAYVVASATVFRFDTSGWRKIDLPRIPYRDVWAADAQHVFMVGGASVVVYDGTAYEEYRNQSISLNGVWGSSASDVLAVGVQGAIWRFDGNKWSEMPSPTSGWLNRVWSSGPTNAYAVGKEDLLHYDGQSWQKLDLPWAVDLVDVWGRGPNEVYVLHPSKLMHFDGQSWNDITFDGANGLTAISGTASGELFVSSERGEIWSRRGGIWREENGQVGDRLNSVWSLSGADDFVVGDRRVVLRTERAEIVSHTSIGTHGVFGVWGSGPDDVFAVGTHAQIHHFDGTRWQPMDSGVDLDLYYLAQLNSVYQSYAVGSFAPVAASGPSTVLVHRGGTWRQETVPNVGELHDVWASDNGFVYAGGQGGAIRYTPSGWRIMRTAEGASMNHLRGVWGTASSDVFFVGLDGGAWRFDGSTVRSIDTDTDIDLFDVWGPSADDILAVGRHGTIMRWDGQRWTREALDLRRPSSLFCPDLRGIHGTSATDVTVVGESGVRLRPIAR